MRLICPSCGAQYEVDESVIPDAGRDVQCSNCGHAWFQRSARQLTAAAEEEARRTEAEAAAPEAPAEADVSEARDLAPEQPEPEEPAAAEPETAEHGSEPDEPSETSEVEAESDADAELASAGPEEPETSEEEMPAETAEVASEPPVEAAEADADTHDEPGEADVENVAPQSPERVRRTLDDAVKNVLREEAQRETRARQAEGSALESQPDLGLATTVSAIVAASAEEPDRVARVRGDENDLDDDALVSRASRRELLPDIEEINSTLRATSERDGEPAAIDAPETLARRRSGFRMGFSTAMLVAVILFGLYLLAPLISSSVPAAEPALTSYVAGVDAARSWLDGQMKSLTQSLQGDRNGG